MLTEYKKESETNTNVKILYLKTVSPQAAHHQVEGVFFKRQKLLVS